MPVITILSFLVSMFICVLLVPPVNKIGSKLGVVAHINERTVHTKEVCRIGGYAIYIAFLIGVVLFLKTDTQVNSILLGGFVIFSTGLYDDMHDISPKLKLLAQFIAACTVIFYGGIMLQGKFFGVPFLPEIITLFWIVGITNAINLIDGLDGLAAGVSTVVLFTISFTSLTTGRVDIAALSLIVAGPLVGFLFYNFHPAKIYMGDSGALFVGFMISVISLLGFGYSTSTFFTLGAPIVVLMIPIMDTVIAIIRRKLRRKSFSEADKKHLHHRLMYKLELGHKNSVLVIYGMTACFSLTSFVYLKNEMGGIFLFLLLMFLFEIFIELTAMISSHYKPVLTLLNVFLKRDDLPKIKFIEQYRLQRTNKTKRKEFFVCAVVIILITGVTMSYCHERPEIFQPKPYVYAISENETKLEASIRKELKKAHDEGLKETEYQLFASYFVCDYFSIKNHTERIGGIDLVHPSIMDEFEEYARNTIYNIQEDTVLYTVLDYEIISHTSSHVRIDGFENNKYYNVFIDYMYEVSGEKVEQSVNVVVMLDENQYYVVGIDDF